MARKKTSKSKAAPAKKESRARKELLSSPSSYRSLLFGIITVVILFLIGVSIFQFIKNRGDINGNGISTQDIGQALKEAGTYTVKPSDTLWGIAESQLGSGFEWPKIADVNNIKTPEDLEEGMKLTIPKNTPTETPALTQVISPTTMQQSTAPTTEVSPTAQTQEQKTETYVIKRGDDLWDIALKVYGDPYRWVEIADANNLDQNPDLIHADNALVIPR